MGSNASKKPKRNSSLRSTSSSQRFVLHKNSYKSSKCDDIGQLSINTPSNSKIKFNSAKLHRKKLFANENKISPNNEQLQEELFNESLPNNDVKNNLDYDIEKIENLRGLSCSDPNFLNIDETQHSSPKGVFLNETTIELANSNCSRINNVDNKIQNVK